MGSRSEIKVRFVSVVDIVVGSKSVLNLELICSYVVEELLDTVHQEVNSDSNMAARRSYLHSRFLRQRLRLPFLK